MSTLQIRDIPESTRRVLKARAAAEGRSLSDYALAILEREAQLPTREEIMQRILAREPVASSESAVEALTSERAAR